MLSGCNTDERTHTEIRPSRYLVRMAETTDLETAEAQERPKEQIVDPWQAVAAEGETSIDYDKLIGMIQCAVHDSIIHNILLTPSFYFQFSLVASELIKSYWPI